MWVKIFLSLLQFCFQYRLYFIAFVRNFCFGEEIVTVWYFWESVFYHKLLTIMYAKLGHSKLQSFSNILLNDILVSKESIISLSNCQEERVYRLSLSIWWRCSGCVEGSLYDKQFMLTSKLTFSGLQPSPFKLKLTHYHNSYIYTS